MLIRIIIVFLHTICVLNCGQVLAQTIQDSVVCSLDKYVSVAELRKSNTVVSNDDTLYKYMREINRVFNVPNSQFSLRKITGRPAAAAHLQHVGEYQAARVITINYDHYSNISSSPVITKALIVWILTHEAQHHINGHLHYEDNSLVTKYKHELLADERAGFAVGIITEVGYDFFSQQLPKILSKSSESETHPPLEYRIIAATAGFIQSKLENKKRVKLNGIKYRKSNGLDGYLNCYQSNSFRKAPAIELRKYKSETIVMGFYKFVDLNGPAIRMYESSLFMGEFLNDKENGYGIRANSSFTYKGEYFNGSMHGNGTLTWSDGDWYKGEFKDDRYNGFGKRFYSHDGSFYSGYWKNNQQHGAGVLYRNDEILYSGFWEEGIFVESKNE